MIWIGAIIGLLVVSGCTVYACVVMAKDERE